MNTATTWVVRARAEVGACDFSRLDYARGIIRIEWRVVNLVVSRMPKIKSFAITCAQIEISADCDHVEIAALIATPLALEYLCLRATNMANGE